MELGVCLASLEDELLMQSLHSFRLQGHDCRYLWSAQNKESTQKGMVCLPALKAVNVRLNRGNQWEAVICNSAVQPKTTITFFVRPVLTPNRTNHQ